MNQAPTILKPSGLMNQVSTSIMDLMNQAPTIIKQCGVDESGLFNLILYRINKSNPFIVFFYKKAGLMNQTSTLFTELMNQSATTL
jgi:hypothetical protein